MILTHLCGVRCPHLTRSCLYVSSLLSHCVIPATCPASDGSQESSTTPPVIPSTNRWNAGSRLVGRIPKRSVETRHRHCERSVAISMCCNVSSRDSREQVRIPAILTYLCGVRCPHLTLSFLQVSFLPPVRLLTEGRNPVSSHGHHAQDSMCCHVSSRDSSE